MVAPGSALAGARAVAVSPDGRSVYVGGNAVTHFFAAPQGQLSYDGCVSNDGSGGTCADVPGLLLDQPYGLAVSPEGNRVDVASLSSTRSRPSPRPPPAS